MNRIKRFIGEWLGFSGREVNGFIILLPLMLVLIFSNPVYRWIVSSQETDFSAEEKMLDSLALLWHEDEKNVNDRSAQEAKNTFSVFAFDPNLAPPEVLQQLGFSKNLSMRIANYRQKGGVFRVKRDLLKIYGMDSTLYHQLYAYIQLPEEQEKREIAIVKTTTAVPTKFDINKADTAQLKKIHGIGTKLADRIVNFREGLGGFIAKEQLFEVYGLDTAVVERLAAACFVEESFEPQKLNLNTSDENTLTAHPYIPKSWAKAIQAYRFQHGDFSDVRDLLKIKIIPPHQAQRIIPYLKVKD